VTWETANALLARRDAIGMNLVAAAFALRDDLIRGPTSSTRPCQPYVAHQQNQDRHRHDPRNEVARHRRTRDAARIRPQVWTGSQPAQGGRHLRD
jgi:hypothetical protein